MVCRKKIFFSIWKYVFFAYPSRFFTLADMKVTMFFTENFFISNVDIIELWAVLITEDGSFKLKALMDACADVDAIGRVEKFCFYLPNVHNMFFSHWLWFYFFTITDTVDTGIENTCRFFSVTESRMCADLYIFTPCSYVFSRTYTQDSMSFNIQYRNRQNSMYN